MLKDVQVSSGGVRGVLSRHKLLTKHDRLLRLEQHLAKHRITLTDDQVRLLDEHFRVMGRKKFYDSVEEMQKDLNAYLRTYNTTRPHQGRNMNGRTPEAAFKSGLPKPKKSKEETNRKAA